MQTNKKLIAGCFLAIIIGVATIVPLAFLTLQLDEHPQFDVQIPYVYIDNYWDNNTATSQQNYGWVYSVYVRTIPKYNLNQFPVNLFPFADAVYEYYSIELISQNGLVGNFFYSTHQEDRGYNPGNFYFDREHWFNANSSRSGYARSGYENGTSLGYITGPADNLNSALGKPDTLSLTVRRQGWIILNHNTTVIHLGDPKIILEVKLERYGNGFIYNNMFTGDELSKINPVMPQFRSGGP